MLSMHRSCLHGTDGPHSGSTPDLLYRIDHRWLAGGAGAHNVTFEGVADPVMAASDLSLLRVSIPPLIALDIFLDLCHGASALA